MTNLGYPFFILLSTQSSPSSYATLDFHVGRDTLTAWYSCDHPSVIRCKVQSAILEAGTGPIPITRGSTPTAAEATMRALGVSPSR